MTCHYCGFHKGGHHEECPVLWDDGRDKVWSRGWDDGRSGEPPKNDGKVYMMGFRQGDVALEEAENGSAW